MSDTPSPDRRLAVVTGAASGIGLATVQALARRGIAVIGVDLSDAPPGLFDDGEVTWIRSDVSEELTWDQVLDACRRQDPRGADCLVACAATLVVAPLLDTPIEDWRRIFEVNVLGVLHGMRTLMPDMLDQGEGAIAVVCSVNSFIVEDQLSAYSVSKAALLHLVRSAALEYASRGLRINAVCPGIIDTPLLQQALDALDDPVGAREAGVRRTPLGRILQPEEIAETLCFLVSAGASGLSGSAITVDGGLTTTHDFDSSSE